MDFLLSLAVALLGSAALALRPPATFISVGVSLAAGVLGAVTPVPRAAVALPATAGDVAAKGAGKLPWAAVTAVGIGTFAVARAIQHPLTPRMGLWLVAATAAVAVAEELLFRRLLYGSLAVYGAALAVCGSAVVFALVHVPAYGVAALPVDLAAGLLFAWQRWASGTWTAPAATHAAANVLQAAW